MTIGVFDLSNYAKRAFHWAYRPNGPEPEAMTNEGGIYASMVKQVLTFIRSDLLACPVDKAVFAIDFAVDSWRKELYPQYKCSRNQPTAEWIRQINFLIDCFKALGLKSKWYKGLEADDIFGVVVGNFPKDEVVIFTNDKDTLQLMQHRRVRIFNPYDRVFVRAEDVYRRFGVGPEKIREYLALQGDDGDDIPGLNNVGPKTAAKVINGDRSIEDWIRQERKEPDKDLQQYQLNYKLTAMVTSGEEALFPWPHMTADDVRIDPPDVDLFKFLWIAKGKVDSRVHPLLDTIRDSHPGGRGGFDDED